MKTILLYGPAEASKRNEFLKIKKAFPQESITQIDYKQSNLTALETQLCSNSLFWDGPRLVVVENVTEKLDLLKLKVPEGDLTLVLLGGSIKSDQVLLQSAMKMKARIMSFEGEKEVSVFPFLDSLIEQKIEAFVKLEELLSQYDANYILSMIYYGLRRNLLPLPQNDFVRRKILQQKQKYQNHDFAKFYLLTLKTEFGIKSGLIEEKIAMTSLMQDIIVSLSRRGTGDKLV